MLSSASLARSKPVLAVNKLFHCFPEGPPAILSAQAQQTPAVRVVSTVPIPSTYGQHGASLQGSFVHTKLVCLVVPMSDSRVYSLAHNFLLS